MRRRWTGALLGCAALAGTGCTSPGTGGAADSAVAGGDTTNPTYPVEDPSPTLEVQDLANRIDQFAFAGAPTGFAIGEAFLAYLENADEFCPAGQSPTSFQQQSCTTAEGWKFEGVGWYDYDQFDEGGDHYTVMSHGGDYRMTSPGGDVMSGGGGIGYELVTSDDEISLFTDFEGSFQDNRSDSWLQQGVSAVSELTASGPMGEIEAELTGGMSVGPVFMDFSHVVFKENSDCSWEPEGTIGIRDDVGYWYTWEVAADCTPCAPVTFAPTGEELGELCADMTVWFEALFHLTVPM